MLPERARYHEIFASGRSTDRLEYFSDAIFAIAITLLVIDISVPHVASEALWSSLVANWTQFFAFALSFVVIAMTWTAHHRMFRVMTGYDQQLVLLNLGLLFCVAFVPYPTKLISEYGGEDVTSVALYAVVVMMLSVLPLAMWAYARGHGLLDEVVDPGVYRYLRRRLMVVPLVMGLSIVVAATLSPRWAMYLWIAIWPARKLADHLRLGGPRNGTTARTDRTVEAETDDSTGDAR